VESLGFAGLLKKRSVEFIRHLERGLNAPQMNDQSPRPPSPWPVSASLATTAAQT